MYIQLYTQSDTSCQVRTPVTTGARYIQVSYYIESTMYHLVTSLWRGLEVWIFDVLRYTPLSVLLCFFVYLKLQKNSIIFVFYGEKIFLALRMNSRHKKLLSGEWQEKKPITCIIEFQLFSFPSQQSYFPTFLESRCSSSSSRCSSGR